LTIGAKATDNNTRVQIRKILVPIDGSGSSMKAADYGVTLAKNGDSSKVVALHVIHSQIKYLYSSTVATLVTPTTIGTIIDRAKQEAQNWLTKVQEKANENDVKLKTEFVVDPTSIVGAIVDYSERQNVDLIVIGSRGLSGFKRLLLGSVASGVVSYAHCPVLVVK
jgi:nucleotide-binding universal stress UspA family protein